MKKTRRLASFCLVDLKGFEPLTSSVRLKRAPNCATGPELSRIVPKRAHRVNPVASRASVG